MQKTFLHKQGTQNKHINTSLVEVSAYIFFQAEADTEHIAIYCIYMHICIYMYGHNEVF